MCSGGECSIVPLVYTIDSILVVFFFENDRVVRAESS